MHVFHTPSRTVPKPQSVPVTAAVRQRGLQAVQRSGPAVRGHHFDQIAPHTLRPDSDGQTLPGPVLQRMQATLGADLGQVRVHENSKASRINARAYTQGQHIHFAPGQYQPHTAHGLALLGHELAHVLQQRQGRVAMPTHGGVPINANVALEAEADRLGAMAARGHRAPVAQTHPTPSAGLPLQAARRPVQRMTRHQYAETEARLQAMGHSLENVEHGRRMRYFPQPYHPERTGDASVVPFGVTPAGQVVRGLDPGGQFSHQARVTYTGSRTGDFAAANAAVGLAATPAGHVWHHYHDYNAVSNQGTMFLMRQAHHAPAHYGGVWQYRQSGGVGY